MDEELMKYASRAGFDYVDNIVQENPGHRWNDHDVEYAYRDGIIAGAERQKQHDAELIEIAYNDGITIGMTKQKEQDLAEMAQSKSPLSVAYANRCFENGKQAMKEQMMKEAIDCVVCAGTEWNKLVITYLGDYESMVNTCKHGDRVRIIIIKDDGKSD